MAIKRKGKFDLIVTGFTIFIFIAIAAYLSLSLGRANIDRSVAEVYAIIAIVGAGIATILAVLQGARFLSGKPSGLTTIFRLGHVSESPKGKILSSPFFRIGIVLLWAVIVGTLAQGGQIIWQSPDLYNGFAEFSQEGVSEQLAVEQFGIGQTILSIGIIPAYTEDMASFGISVFLTIAFLLVIYSLGVATRAKWFKITPPFIVIAILISCPIAALIFSQAHEIVAGQNIQFLFAAWIFQTINLYVIWFTGLFIPLAHIIHNSVFALGLTTALSIALMLIPFIKIRRSIK